jgi:hypothetical protein
MKYKPNVKGNKRQLINDFWKNFLFKQISFSTKKANKLTLFHFLLFYYHVKQSPKTESSVKQIL